MTPMIEARIAEQRDRGQALRQMAATLARAIADSEERLADALDRLVAPPPDGGERRRRLAQHARDYAVSERALADRYER